MQGENLASFTDFLSDADEIANSQPISFPSSPEIVSRTAPLVDRPLYNVISYERPAKRTGQHGDFRSIEEIDPKYRDVFSFPYFNLVQSSVIEDALYSDKSIVVSAPTGSGKTVVFEMAIVQLLMAMEEKNYIGDFKIIYMAPVKSLCTERLSEWYPKFTKLGLNCIEVTGDTDVDFSHLKPYRIIITTPEKWDMLTRRWRDHRGLVEVIKLFLIDEVHILNEISRGPVLEAVVSRMKTIESSSQSAHRIEQLQQQYQTSSCQGSMSICQGNMSFAIDKSCPPRIRFVAVSATVSNPEDVAAWLGTDDKPAVYYKFGDECRPVQVKRVVEGYPCPEGMSIFKFDIILNYKLWPIIKKHHNGKPTLIFCNTRKSVTLTAEALSRELTINFTTEQKAKLTSLACKIKNKKLQALVVSGVGCHHAGLLYEERLSIENAFRNKDLPILITTTTLAMGVNLPAHLVIIKNTQQYVNGSYQEYSISTVLQMVGRAGRPQFDTEATAVIMTRLADKARYQALVGGSEPLQSYLHMRLAENLNSEAALGTVCDVAQCVQWLRSTFLCVRAAKDPRRYLGLPQNAPVALITKKIEELCVKAMNGLASAGLITMDEACCIESTEAGRLMSIFYLDLETMKQIMKIDGSETLERMLWVVCECHELADMHLRVDERRTLNSLNRNNAAATIRFPMKGKISSRQMKLNCIIQAVLGCLPIPDPSLNQEAMKIMRIALRVCKCLVAYVTRPDLITTQPKYYAAVLNTLILSKCIQAHLWENSPYMSKQLKGIGPTFSTLLATAGKVNFTLLEESHPRDLERIMNKGAPAGNFLRKQVCLLPKYQLTATPIDEKRVSIQLTLLNKHHLAENRDQLTATASHKCYILVGDSENNLLLLSSFKDNDLMSVYDGIITYEVTRKHSFEHKILIHCISSTWVGVDTDCDYVFQNLDPTFSRGEAFYNTKSLNTITKKSATIKQTSITDVYKERKRKSNEIDITQSKEKKKRENALLDKFKCLKNSFEVTSKEIKEDLNKTAKISKNIFRNISDPDKNKYILQNENDLLISPNISKMHTSESLPIKEISNVNELDDLNTNEDLNDEDNFIVDDRINSILNEIETEIYKNNVTDVSPKNSQDFNVQQNQIRNYNTLKKDNQVSGSVSLYQDIQPALEVTTLTNQFKKPKLNDNKKRRKNSNSKSNFSFIDSINKTNFSEDFEYDDSTKSGTHGFTDAIKDQIESFLRKTTEVKTDYNKDINNILTSSINIDNNDKLLKTDSCLENRVEFAPELPNICIDNKNNKSDDYFRDEARQTSLRVEEKVYMSPQKESTHISAPSINVHTKDIKHQSESNCTSNLNYLCNVPSNEDVKSNDLGVRKIIDISDQNSTTKELLKKISNMTINRTSINQPDNMGIEECDTEAIKSYVNPVKIKDNIRELNSSNERLLEQNETNTLSSIQHNTTESTDQQKEKVIKESDKASILVHSQHWPVLSTADVQETNLFIKSFNTSESNNAKYLTPLHTIHPLIGNEEHELVNCKQITRKPTHGAYQPMQPNSSYDITVHQSPKDSLTCNNREYQLETALSLDNNNEKGSACESHSSYVNRYSISSTKIDVCTKNTPEHVIHFIRKVKLDVDVTEIVTNQNKAHKKEEFAFVNNENIKKCGDDLDDPLLASPTTQNYASEKKVVDFSPIADMEITNTKQEQLNIPNQCIPMIEPNPKNTIMEENLPSEDNKIKNILSRYSKKLRKPINPTVEKHLVEDKTNNPAQVKTKKPFSISDIHNSNIPIPNVLIAKCSNDKVHIENSVTEPEVEGIIFSDSPKFDTTNLPIYSDDNECMDEIPEHLSPVPETENLEFNLDQSLLNPKTLLQQYFPCEIENSNNIIPPPLMFCSSENDIDNLPNEHDVDSFTQSYLQSTNDLVDVLTPSKEIETWTLSKNDDQDDFSTCKVENTCNATKSFTILRKISPYRKHCSLLPSQENENLRGCKLNKFKFLRKAKLKM